MSPRFAVVYSRDYAKQYPSSDVAECLSDGADPCWMCIDTTNARVLGADGGAPEDALLVRDWKWVARELNAVNAERDDAREKLRALVEAIDLVAALKKRAGRPGGQSCNVQAAQHAELAAQVRQAEWLRHAIDGESARRAYEAALRAARGAL